MTHPGAGGAAGPPPRRVLLDECVPRRLKRALPGLDVVHVRGVDWTGKRNGVLLGLMLGAGYEVFVCGVSTSAALLACERHRSRTARA